MQMDVRDVTQVITGYYTVPLRHGMTAGEVARYFNADANVNAELRVIPVDGWRGGTWFDEAGLPWLNPSPNIRSLDGALKYAGMVLAEATNLSVGRGTDAPVHVPGRAVDGRAAGAGSGATATTWRGCGWTRCGWCRQPGPQRLGALPRRERALRAAAVTDREAFDPPFTALVLLSEIRRSTRSSSASPTRGSRR
jgi:hypothetical protein